MTSKETEIHTGKTSRIGNEDSFRHIANLFGVSESTVHQDCK